VVNLLKYNKLDPLPIVTSPVDVPVLILVTKFELAFKFIDAPDMVAPDCPVSNPDEVIAPSPVVEIFPVVVISSPKLEGDKTPKRSFRVQ
jgi:hypothetical protein